MYSFDSRVRYSEVDEDRKLSLTGVINYMQDCSTFQSLLGSVVLFGKRKSVFDTSTPLPLNLEGWGFLFSSFAS